MFEADFLPCSASGSARSGRPPTPWKRLRVGVHRGQQFVFEADIENFFGEHRPRAGCSSLVGERVSDRRVLKLLATVVAGRGDGRTGCVSETVTGTPQGGVISPLLANVYLHAFDRAWADAAASEKLVRYADDFVVLCTIPGTRPSRLRSGRPPSWVTSVSALHPDKTRVVDLREGKEGFDFLGCHLHARMSGKLWEQTADHPLLPPPLAVRAVHEAGPSQGQGPHRSKPGADRSWRTSSHG